MRIHIVGAAGAGKTTLARRLAAHLHCPHVELDALYWQPNWARTPAAHFQAAVLRALHSPAWVADGSYESVREQIWAQADHVLWLDYGAHVLAWRSFWRGVGNIVHHTDLWGTGNHESWGWLLSRESIVVRSLAARQRMRADYATCWAHPRYGRRHFVYLPTPEATRRWLAAFLRSTSLPPGHLAASIL